jgi:streptogramin lyase
MSRLRNMACERARVAGRAAGALAVTVGLSLLLTVPADAKPLGEKLPFALGLIGRPNAVAVDQATGDVYVTDHATRTVKIFAGEGGAPAGTPVEVTGAETPSGSFNFAESEEPVGVAVDENGDLYVADVGHRVVDKFKLEGGEYKYVCQFTGFGNTGDGCLPNLVTQETNPAEPFTGPGGIAIDSHGNVYVSNFGGAVYEFNVAGEDVRRATIPTGEPSGLAVDSNGVVYVQDYQGPVYRLTLNASNEFEVAMFDAEKSFAVAVDPATNNVLVDHRGYVVERGSPEGGSPGEIIGELRPAEATSSEGVAISSATHTIYVANILSQSVDAYKFVKVPDVTLNEPSPITARTATLHGEINPEETTEASSHFEYAEAVSGASESSTALEPVAPVNTYLPTSAELTGLTPNTEYAYRLLATNSSHLTGSSEVKTFKTTTAKPEITLAEAVEPTTSGVLFRGEINPENTPPTTYHFEYGEVGGQLQSLAPVAIGATATPVPVEQSLPSGLRPNTEYAFRLSSSNSAGITMSTEKTFTTPPAPNIPTTPPLVEAGPAASISQTTATLTAGINPESLPTLYEFEFGPASTPAGTYGTVLFGGEVGNESGTIPVALSVGSLQPGVTYRYRAVAVNTAGTEYGAENVFTTAAQSTGITAPSVVPLIASTPIPFPTEMGVIPVLATPKTRAQKLKQALKQCKRERGKARRKLCEKKARSKFGGGRSA